jgi:hypothetical protein
MTTLFNRNTLKFAVISAVFSLSPMAHSASDIVYSPNQAYEEFSGTHASTNKVAPANETRKANPGSLSAGINDAFEELSGTHAPVKAMKSGLAGKPGPMGEADRNGVKSGTAPSMFDIPGDVPGGCNKYLRCSGF